MTTSHWGAGPYWGAWGAPYAPYGPSAAYHADPSPHGHDGYVVYSQSIYSNYMQSNKTLTFLLSFRRKYVATTRGSQHVAPLVRK